MIAQEVQKVEVVKNDNQITDLFEELGSNEFKLDLLDLIASTSFDITYERIKDPYSSFGASMYINLNDDNSHSTDSIFLTKKIMVVLGFLLKFFQNFHL